MSRTDPITLAFVWAIATFAVVFLLTPLAVTVAVSFGSSTVFSLPPPSWSTRWYEALPGTRGLWSSLWVSVQIAALSTAISLALGTACAIALVREEPAKAERLRRDGQGQGQAQTQRSDEGFHGSDLS